MNRTLKIPYALKDGRLTHVSEVPSGQKCGCICINCNEPLVARKGQMRTAHFAHRVSSNCSPESALHKIAKQLLKRRIDNAIAAQESLPFSWDCKYCKEAHQANLVRRAIKCEEEHVIDSARADIALLDEAGKAYAALEVVVTHKPDKQALETYERENVTLLRFDLKSERDLVKITDLESLRPDFAGHCLMPRCKHCRMFLKNRQLDVVEGGCWRCGQSMLIAFGNDGLTMMSPEEFDEIEIAAVRAKGVVLEVRYSKTVDSKYLANVCPHCRAISGSFYLHDYWYLSTEETKLNVSMGCPRCEKVYPKS